MSSTRRRFRRAIAGPLCRVAAVAFMIGSFQSSPAAAKCEGPSISVNRTVVGPGDLIEITGQAFGSGCNDTGDSRPALGEPQNDTLVGFVQPGNIHHLFRVDAAKNYRFKVRIAVPVTARPGSALLKVVSSDLPSTSTAVRPAHLRVRSGATASNEGSSKPVFLIGTASRPHVPPRHAKTAWWVWIIGAVMAAGAAVAFTAGRSSRRGPLERTGR